MVPPVLYRGHDCVWRRLRRRGAEMALRWPWADPFSSRGDLIVIVG